MRFPFYSFIYHDNEFFFYWNRKNSSLSWQINFHSFTSKITLMSLLGSHSFFTQHRETLPCWNTKLCREGLLRNPCPRGHGLAALPMDMVPFVFSTRTEFLCTRARVLFIIQFQFNHLFLFSKKKQNSNYNFFFTLSRFLLYVCRWGWFDGNERCAISTARSKNETAFE